MITAIVILFIIVILQAILFAYLQKRQDNMIVQIATIMGWCDTLRGNDEVLAKDIRKVYHEVRNTKES